MLKTVAKQVKCMCGKYCFMHLIGYMYLETIYVLVAPRATHMVTAGTRRHLFGKPQLK